MDWGNNKIPESFPDNVLKVREGYNENLGLSKYVMHENYRKTDSEELHYFVTRLLPCVNTKYTSYNKKCRDKRVSEVFTPNDEAFALALLMNELESYNFIIAKREKAITSNTMKKKKPFTSSASGNKVGWNHHGLETYELMEGEIEDRRKEDASTKFEERVMEEFITNAGGKANKRTKRKVINDGEYSFEATFRKKPALWKYCTEQTVIKNCDSD